MERSAYSRLCEWKNKNDRKPLILNGARQVGKTWLLKEFGRREYEDLAYINCDDTPEMKSAFSDYDTARLIRVFSALSGVSIKPQNTLLVLDEIQEIPDGLTSLKYFCENAPEYHIAVAGSLLGIGIHEGTGFPVGKVDEINLYPMTFAEFINALGKRELAKQMTEHRWSELSTLSHTFIELLRQYYYVGGMPAVVDSFSRKQDIQEVRVLQKQILTDYRRDFSKHIPKDILPKVNLVWDSIPSQLAKENKKFIYSAVKKGARAKDFENAIQWLADAGLVIKVSRIRKIEKPLKFYEDFDAFKLFLLDMGLMGAMTEVSPKDVLVNNKAFSEYKGAFTEQYVLQELSTLENNIYYYSKDSSTLEVDFVIQKNEVYPIEVKAEENVRSKSLRVIYESNNSLRPCRFSMNDYREQEWMVNVPLYLAREWIKTAE
ncbi:MAG: ATP-binding protein [Lachnospiraceae bacterium]|nr:ATP-binding protein [Lachnospiraceae bacterium]